MLTKSETQVFVAKPRYEDIRFREIGCQQQRIVGPFLEAHQNRLLLDGHVRGGIHEIAKDVPRFGPFIAVADARTE